MAYPAGTPAEEMADVYTSGDFTPEHVVQYIRDNYTPVNKNSIRNSIGYQTSLVQNWINKKYAGRDTDRILSGFFESIYSNYQISTRNVNEHSFDDTDHQQVYHFSGGYYDVDVNGTGVLDIYMANETDPEWSFVPLGTHLYVNVNTGGGSPAEARLWFGQRYSSSFGSEFIYLTNGYTQPGGFGNVIHFMMTEYGSSRWWKPVADYGIDRRKFNTLYTNYLSTPDATITELDSDLIVSDTISGDILNCASGTFDSVDSKHFSYSGYQTITTNTGGNYAFDVTHGLITVETPNSVGDRVLYPSGANIPIGTVITITRTYSASESGSDIWIKNGGLTEAPSTSGKLGGGNYDEAIQLIRAGGIPAYWRFISSPESS